MIKKNLNNPFIKGVYDKEEFEQSLYQLICKLEIKFIKTINCNQLIIDKRAPYACQYGCKNYNRHYSCPPYSYSPSVFKDKLKKWDNVVIFAIAKTLEEFWIGKHKRDLKKFSFWHKKILSRLTENYMRKILFDIENFFKNRGYLVFGLAGGSCHSCRTCGLKEGKKCKKPYKMRMSLESLGIDVEKTFTQNGYDIAMPNYGSSIRAAGLLIKGNLPNIFFNFQTSPQQFRQAKKINLELLFDRKKIEFLEEIDIRNIIQKQTPICKSDCPHYNNNYSCPTFANPINLNLWSKAIIWKWNKNPYKTHSYSKTIELIHKRIFYQGHYFALPLRHCQCDYCNICSYKEKINDKTDLRNPCKRYKVLAPAMESQNISMNQFGDGLFGIELI